MPVVPAWPPLNVGKLGSWERGDEGVGSDPRSLPLGTCVGNDEGRAPLPLVPCHVASQSGTAWEWPRKSRGDAQWPR